MALVSNCPSDHRIYKPSLASEFPSPEEESESRSRLLRKIHAFYLKAMKRLDSREPKRRRRVSADRFVLCVGLLDPVSNIVVDDLSSRNKERRWRRGDRARLEDLELRSLDAMLTFLTRLFPNLAESQAVRYLLLAGADVLVAARAVASDAGMARFESSESRPAAVEALAMALRCAALAAGHPDPGRLVSAWRAVSARVDDAVRLLALPRSRGVRKLARLLRAPPPAARHAGRREDLWWAWQFAAARRLRPRRVPFRHTGLLNRTLQDAIHGLYLKAVARLPAGELRHRFHRSLLKAGHCYGPLDPVANIIVNTIWYDAAFPRTHELELDMIGTRSLHRVENQSLYAMASFLCTRYHRIDFHQAVRRLLQADASLLLADPNLDPAAASVSFGMWGGGVLRCREGDHCNALAQDPDTGVEEAFLAAAIAAHHPNREAQVKLLASCEAMLGSSGMSMLQGSGKLSSEDVQRLAMLLCPEPPCKTKPLPPLPLTEYPRAEVASAYATISKKVHAVLNAYDRTPDGDPTFELHMICGVNRSVAGPVGSRHAYYHSHINFVATPKNPYGGRVPVLFFAEISIDGNDRSFCCPVSLPLPCAAQSRCLYCEYMGIRVVHPVGIDFHGREVEFEKMACGEDPCGDNLLVPTVIQPFYSNLEIINQSCLMANAVHGRLKEDSLYDDHDERKRVRVLSSESSWAVKVLRLMPSSCYV